MELRILELLAAFFLFLSIARPLVRGLWKLDGLTLCPLLALGIITGVFPAYGFRPECIPLLLFTLFIIFANFSDLIALFSGLKSDFYRDKGLFFTFAAVAGFAFTLWISFFYAPSMNLELSSEGAETLTLRNRGTEFFVRIYSSLDGVETGAGTEAPGGTAPDQEAPGSGDRPLLIFLPPAAGSLGVTSGVCAALRDRGFTVLTYSRPGLDSPAFDGEGMPVRLSPAGLYRLANVLLQGLSDASSNEWGRAMEEDRRRDVEFLLDEIKNLKDRLPGTDTGTVFLAGYGAGGAALTVFAGTGNPANRYRQVRGIIAVEAPLLSSMEGPPPDNPQSWKNSGLFRRFAPEKITRIKSVPRPEIPILFILSDRVIKNRSGRYETVLRTLGASQTTALLAAVPGAGPFDYSDSPRYYPIYSFLFPGDAAGQRKPGPELTAAVMVNFAAFILESGDSPVPLVKTTIPNIYLETGGVWHNPDSRAILHP